MNWVDIVIIVVALAFCAGGLKNGAIQTACGAAGLLVGIWLAGTYGARAATLFGDAAWAEITGYILVLVIVVVIFNIIGSILKRVVGMVMLGWVDRLVGGILGLAMGAFACAAVLTIIVDATFIPAFPQLSSILQAIHDSALARALMERFPLVLALIPGEIGDTVRDFFD